MPNVSRMDDWRLEKAFCAAASDAVLRETVISTILPEEIEGGRRIDGNSIYQLFSWSLKLSDTRGSYQPFVLGQQHGYTGVDLPNGK